MVQSVAVVDFGVDRVRLANNEAPAGVRVRLLSGTALSAAVAKRQLRRQTFWLTTASPALTVLTLAVVAVPAFFVGGTAHAQSLGGAGGAGNHKNYGSAGPGGAGGTTTTPAGQAGSAGTGYAGSGGGGGGGATGGAGGNGAQAQNGSPGGLGGAAGTGASPNGQVGGAGSAGYGSGAGGGGGGGGFSGGIGTLSNTGSLIGGHGGVGGSGGGCGGYCGEYTTSGGGGGGGAGGQGFLVSASNSTNSNAVGATVTGGAGGAGGYTNFGNASGQGGAGGIGGAGVQISASATNASLTNAGAIAGGAGGNGGAASYRGASGASGAGGVGVAFLAAGSLTNSGTITGGGGGSGLPAPGYGNAGIGSPGAVGVSMTSGGTISNAAAGTIAGGVGAPSFAGAPATDGGIGITGTGLAVTNGGFITGGMGGAGGSGVAAATGGVGIVFTSGSASSLTNTATVMGGQGGAGAVGGAGGTGGIAVSFVSGTTFDNTGGQLIGGRGGTGGAGVAGAAGASLSGTQTNAATITGQAGSAGGAGGAGGAASGTGSGTDVAGVGGVGGAGGTGGVGIALATGASLTNTGAITGGVGGAGGTGGTGSTAGAAGAVGLAGAGISGSGIAVTLSTGTIGGGLAGGIRADSIDFTGGANTLTLNSGSTGALTGSVGVTGSLAIAGNGSMIVAIHDYTTAGSVTKADTGFVTLNAASTYTGGTIISAGGLLTTNVNGFGTGALSIGSGAQSLLQAPTGIFANAVSGAGLFTAQNTSGANTLTLSGALTGALALNVSNGGTVALTNAGNARTGATSIGASTTLSGTIAALSSGAITDSGTLAYTGGSGTVASAITGTGAVSFTGGGTLTLTGADTYTGGTTVSGASNLIVGNGTTSGSIAGPITLSGSTIFFRRNDGYVNNSAITGTGNASVIIQGAMTLNGNVSTPGGVSVQATNVTLGGTVGGSNTNADGGYGSAVMIQQANVALTIAPAGQIQGGGYIGVRVATSGDTVTNLGAITNTGTSGADAVGAGVAVYAAGGTTTITNGSATNTTATISGQNNAVNQRGSATTALTIANYGKLTSTTYSAFENSGSAGALTVSNTGANAAIYANNSNGLNVNAASGLVLTNGGIVSGANDGVYSAGIAKISNSGTVAAGTYSGGTVTTGGVNAVQLAAGGAVTNTGTIKANSVGIASSAGIVLANIGTKSGSVFTGGIVTANTGSDAVNVIGGTSATNTVLNSGLLQSAGFSGLVLYAGGTVTNAAGGQITGGSNASFGEGVQLAGAATVNNYGTINSTGSPSTATGIYQTGNAATTINLFAGSTTGSILLGSAADTLTLYNGRGTGGGATTTTYTDAVTGATSAPLTLQLAGTLASATVGAVNLGGGANTLGLRGTGDGAAANGVAGSVGLDAIANVATITKQDGGTWTLTGAAAASTAAATINAGVGGAAGSGGLLIFSGSGLTGTINVNGATIRATSAGAFGTGTITATDPTIQYGATGTYANAIVLASTNPMTDPTNLQADNGVNATLTGTISEATTGQPLVINAAGGTGIITLTGTNTYTGPTTVAGGTLVVNGANQSAAGISSGATLAGAGSVGATTIADGGILSGVQGGTLTMASLGLTSGSIVNATFSGANGSPLFAVTGNLTLDGTVNVASTGAFGIGVYRLASYGGTLTDNGLLVGTTPTDAQRVTVQTSVAGQVNIVDSSSVLSYWDGGNAALYNNGAVDGGSGTWTATSPTWTDANGLVNGAMSPQPGFAVFEAAPGTVTVDNSAGAIAVTGMQFASNGYVVTGGPIGLAAAATPIRVGDGTSAGAGYRAVIASALTGAGGLNKTDLGTLVLSGANTYTGMTTVSGGTLQGTTSSIVGSAIIDNATLAYNQVAAGTVVQAISGSGVVTVTGIGAGNALTFAGNDTQAGGFQVTDASATVFAGKATGAATEVTLQGAGATLTNMGGSVIVGTTYGVNGSSASTIVNSGTIAAGTYNAATGAVTPGGTDGVYLAGGGTVTNNAGGLIEGARQGVEFAAAGGRLNNAGTITSTATGNAVGDFYTASTGVIVANSGTINFVSPSTGAWGVALFGTGSQIVNTGTISADVGVELQGAGASALLNGQGGRIAGTTYGVETSGAGALTFTNYGVVTGPVSVLATGANSLVLQAGSNMGAVVTGTGADTLALYTGSVTTAAVVDATTGLTVQSAGTHAAAIMGAIDLGTGVNGLALRGAGDGSAANGAAASIGLNTVANVATITKQDGGTWTLAGAATASVAGATINAGVGGTPGSGGLLIFSGTGLTGPIYVNGATIRATTGGAFGTGTIYEVDPTTQFAATATYANNFVLQSANPATDPTRFQTFGTGITATLSGAITQGAGVAAQPLVFGSVDANGTANTGTFVLTNTANAWAGATTINAGTTLQGTTATLSGASFTDNGVLDFHQAAAGTSGKAISGTGTVLIDNGGAVTLTGAITAAGGVQVGAATTATLSSVASASGNAVMFVGAGATLNVAAGGSITGTNGNALFSSQANNTVNNAGMLAGNATYTAIYLNAGTGTDMIANSGTITGYNAIDSYATLALTNSGTLTGLTGNAVFANATGAVTNSGTINGLSNGQDITAAVFFGGAGTVTNTAGTISGNRGVQLQNGGAVANYGQITGISSAGVRLNNGGTVTNYASGTINAVAAGGYGIFTSGAGVIDNQGVITANSGIVANVAGATVTNEGTISATVNGVWGLGIAANLTNMGTISGGTTGVRGEAAGSSIINGGTIQASTAAGVGVYLAGGTLANQAGGTISGGVQPGGGYGTAIQLAGTGNVLNLQAGSTVNGTIDAGATNDASNGYTVSGTLNGGFTGGSGNDTLTLATPATVTGSLNGGAGTDTLVLTGTGAGTLQSAQVASFETASKTGTGSWTLTGTTAASPAAYSVSAGTLNIGGGNAIADTAGVTIASGATLGLLSNETIDVLAGAGSVTLAGNTLGIGAAGGSATFAGTVSGTGGLTKLGSGNETLSGANTYTGATAVMAGTLSLGASDRIADTTMLGVASGATFDLAGYNETVGTIAGGGTLALGTGTLIAGGTNADYAFGGNVTGTGDLTKVGTGTFSLVGNAAMTGRLNVNAGTLMLAGTTAGSVRVQGGTLTGASAIAGNLLLSSGTLSPGIATQPVGMIQAGSLTITGGTTVFDFGGMASGFTADLLKITGAATLSGGTVTTRGLDTSANYRMEQTYTILTAGTLTGTYANGGSFTPVSNNSDLYYRLRYDLVANGVVLEVRNTTNLAATLGSGASGNELAVARALNAGILTASDSFAATLNAVSLLSPDQRRTTLDSLGGESIADISTSVALIADRFTDLLRQRLAIGGGSSSDASLVAGIAGGRRGLDQIRASGQIGAERSSFVDGSRDTHAGAWVQTFGGAGRLDGSNGTASIRDQSYGVAAGIDAKIAGLTVGGAFAATALDTRIEGRASTNRGTLYQGGGYVAYDSGIAYASAVGSYFSGDVDSRRQVYVGATLQGGAMGTARVTGYTAGGAAGYRVALGGGTRFTPQVSGQATHVDRGAFTETGTGGLSLAADKDVRNLYTATVEGRLSHVSAAPGGIIEPYAGAGVAFNFGDLDTLAANRFVGAPTGTGAFSIAGARLASTTALINGGIEAYPTDRVTLGMGVETRLSNRERDGRLELHVKLGF